MLLCCFIFFQISSGNATSVTSSIAMMLQCVIIASRKTYEFTEFYIWASVVEVGLAVL